MSLHVMPMAQTYEVVSVKSLLPVNINRYDVVYLVCWCYDALRAAYSALVVTSHHHCGTQSQPRHALVERCCLLVARVCII